MAESNSADSSNNASSTTAAAPVAVEEPAVDPDKFRCGACTFINTNHNWKCEMCNTARDMDTFRVGETFLVPPNTKRLKVVCVHVASKEIELESPVGKLKMSQLQDLLDGPGPSLFDPFNPDELAVPPFMRRHSSSQSTPSFIDAFDRLQKAVHVPPSTLSDSEKKQLMADLAELKTAVCGDRRLNSNRNPAVEALLQKPDLLHNFAEPLKVYMGTEVGGKMLSLANDVLSRGKSNANALKMADDKFISAVLGLMTKQAATTKEKDGIECSKNLLVLLAVLCEFNPDETSDLADAALKCLVIMSAAATDSANAAEAETRSGSGGGKRRKKKKKKQKARDGPPLVLAEHVPSLAAIVECVWPYFSQLIESTGKVTTATTKRAVKAVWSVVWSLVHHFDAQKVRRWGRAAISASTASNGDDSSKKLLKVVKMFMQLLAIAHKYLSVCGTEDPAAPSSDLADAMGTLHGAVVLACACVGELSPDIFGYMHRILVEQVVDFFEALESNDSKGEHAVLDDLVLLEILLSAEHVLNYDVAKSLQAFYCKHKPNLADYSDIELLRHRGSEASLWEQLKRDFGEAPGCPPTLPKDSACSTWGTRKGAPQVGDTVQVTGGSSSKASLMASCSEASVCVVQVASRYGRHSGNLRVVPLLSVAKQKRSQNMFSKTNQATRLLMQLRGSGNPDTHERLSRFKKFSVLETQLRAFVSAPGPSHSFPPSFQNPFGAPRGYPSVRSADSDSSSSDIPPYIPFEMRGYLGGESPPVDPADLIGFGNGPPAGAPIMFPGGQPPRGSPPSGLFAPSPPPSSSSSRSRPSMSAMFGGPSPRGMPSFSPSGQPPRRPDYARYSSRNGGDSGSDSQPSVDDLVDAFPFRDHPGMPDDVSALRELLGSHRSSRGRRPFDGSRLSEHARRLIRARQSLNRSDVMHGAVRELNRSIEQVFQRVRSAPGDDAVIHRIRPILQQFVLLRGGINDFKSSSGEPLLPFAVRHGTTVKVLEYLIKTVQCDLDATSSSGPDTTALCVAVEVGNSEAVNLFLECGANAEPALSLLKNTKRSGHWEFQGDGQEWQRYEPSTNVKIEKAYQRSLTNRGKPENVEITCGRSKYRVWFTDSSSNSPLRRTFAKRNPPHGKTAITSNTFSQENVNTHYRRLVRRKYFDQKTVAAILTAAKKAKMSKSATNGAKPAATNSPVATNPQTPDVAKTTAVENDGVAASATSWPSSPFGVTLTTTRSEKDSDSTRRRHRHSSESIKDPLGLDTENRTAHPMALVVWQEVLPAVMALSRRPNNQRKLQLRIVQHLAFLTDMGMFRGDPFMLTPEKQDQTSGAASNDTQNAAKSDTPESVSPADASKKEKMDVEEPVTETPEEADELTMMLSGVAWALQPLFDDDDVGAAVLAAHVMRGLLRFSAKAISCAQGDSASSKHRRSAQAAAFVLLSFEKQHGLLSLLRLRGLDAKPRQSLLEALKLTGKGKLSSEAKTAITAVERSRKVLQATFKALHKLLMSAGGPRTITTPNTAGLKKISHALTRALGATVGSAAAAKQKLNDLANMLDMSCNLDSDAVDVADTNASDDESGDAAANSADKLVEFAIGRSPLTTCEVVHNDLAGVLLAYLMAPRVTATVSHKTNSPDKNFKIQPQNSQQDMERCMQRQRQFYEVFLGDFGKDGTTTGLLRLQQLVSALQRCVSHNLLLPGLSQRSSHGGGLDLVGRKLKLVCHRIRNSKTCATVPARATLNAKQTEKPLPHRHEVLLQASAEEISAALKTRGLPCKGPKGALRKRLKDAFLQELEAMQDCTACVPNTEMRHSVRFLERQLLQQVKITDPAYVQWARTLAAKRYWIRFKRERDELSWKEAQVLRYDDETGLHTFKLCKNDGGGEHSGRLCTMAALEVRTQRAAPAVAARGSDEPDPSRRYWQLRLADKEVMPAFLREYAGEQIESLERKFLIAAGLRSLDQAALFLGWSSRTEFRRKLATWYTGGPGSGQTMVKRVRKKSCEKIKSAIKQLVEEDMITIVCDTNDESTEKEPGTAEADPLMPPPSRLVRQFSALNDPNSTGGDDETIALNRYERPDALLSVEVPRVHATFALASSSHRGRAHELMQLGESPVRLRGVDKYDVSQSPLLSVEQQKAFAIVSPGDKMLAYELGPRGLFWYGTDQHGREGRFPVHVSAPVDAVASSGGGANASTTSNTSTPSSNSSTGHKMSVFDSTSDSYSDTNTNSGNNGVKLRQMPKSTLLKSLLAMARGKCTRSAKPKPPPAYGLDLSNGATLYFDVEVEWKSQKSQSKSTHPFGKRVAQPTNVSGENVLKKRAQEVTTSPDTTDVTEAPADGVLLQELVGCGLSGEQGVINALLLMKLLHGMQEAGKLPMLPNQEDGSLSFWCNHQLTMLVDELLSPDNGAAIITGMLPRWLELILLLFPFMVDVEVRKKYLRATTFGLSRAMAQCLRDEEQGLRLRKVIVNDVRLGGPDVLEDARFLMQEHGATKPVINVLGRGPATGPAVTKTFYNNVAKEMLAAEVPRIAANGRNDVSGASVKLFIPEKVTVRPSAAAGATEPMSWRYLSTKTGFFPFPIEPQLSSDVSSVEQYFKLMGQLTARSLQDEFLCPLDLHPLFLDLMLGRVKSNDLRPEHLRQAFSHNGRKTLHSNPIVGITCIAIGLADGTITASTLCREVGLRDEDGQIYGTGCVGADPTTVAEFLSFLPDFEFRHLPEPPEELCFTADTLYEDCCKLARFWLHDCMKLQTAAFRRGYEMVSPVSALCMFDPQELHTMLFGESVLEFTKKLLYENLKRSGKIANGTDPRFEWLVEVLCEFDKTQFPAGGFSSLEPPIEVHGGRQENMMYPEANVCFHQVYLPEHYASKEELRQGLLDAFKNGQHNQDPFGRK